MDQIDINLLEAWLKFGQLCRREPREALRRWRRRMKKTVFRPLRPWCLCLRAADTRIDAWRAVIKPADAIERFKEHRVTLDGRAIGLLTKPVLIPWPGVPSWEAAQRLGVSHHRAWLWARKGHLAIERYDHSRIYGINCRPIPIVWTPSAVDANFPACKPPDPVWGSLWQAQWQRLPASFIQTMRRTPRYLRWKGRWVFRGWDWVCGGRVGEDGIHRPCGRTCYYMFAPLPVWTLAKSTDQAWSLAMPKGMGLVGEWEPGLQETPVGSGNRVFACKHCWQVRSITLSNHTGWNDFVTHLSGGLLYGHEVARPLEEVPLARKRRKWKWKPKRPPKAQAAEAIGAT